MHIAGTHHIALVTHDLPRLRDFYTDALGLPLIGEFIGHGIVFLGAGETAIELIQKDGAAARQGETGWAHLALEVHDLDEAHAGLTARGVAFHIAPMDFPPEAPAVRIAFFRDPDGNEVELVQPLAARYPAPAKSAGGSS